MVAFRLVLGLEILVAGCSSVSLSIAPGQRPAEVCPIEGCGLASTEQRRVEVAPDPCGRAEDPPCSGRAPAECTEAALTSWGSAQDVRTIGCVSRMLLDACSLHDAAACSFAGRLTLDGHGVPRDVRRGLDLLEQGCDGGFISACAVAASWLADTSHAQQFDAASDMHTRLEAKQACLVGQADDCYELGLAYYFGRQSFPTDRVRAVWAYERACDLGDARACNNLGDARAYGDGIERDVTRAAKLFERACHRGEALGCANLGYMLEHGEGVAQDITRARALYRDACMTGEVYGCLHSALRAAVDAGAPSDPIAALNHWRRGCERDRNARSCAFVGLLYEDGPDGQARDEAKSQEAMTRACQLGEHHACAWLKSRVDD